MERFNFSACGRHYMDSVDSQKSSWFCKMEAVVTHSDGKSLNRLSILVVGVAAQKIPPLLSLIIQTLKTQSVPNQTLFVHTGSRHSQQLVLT